MLHILPFTSGCWFTASPANRGRVANVRRQICRSRERLHSHVTIWKLPTLSVWSPDGPLHTSCEHAHGAGCAPVWAHRPVSHHHHPFVSLQQIHISIFLFRFENIIPLEADVRSQIFFVFFYYRHLIFKQADFQCVVFSVMVRRQFWLWGLRDNIYTGQDKASSHYITLYRHTEHTHTQLQLLALMFSRGVC